MSEEVFVRSEADDLTRLIADRLGERQRKLEKMNAWEQQARRTIPMRPLMATLAIAACLTVVWMLLPPWHQTESPLDKLGIDNPLMEEYRAAAPLIPTINQCMQEQKYEEALHYTEQALSQSEQEMERLHGLTNQENDEALLYEEEAEKMYHTQLQWTYIYLLVRTGENVKACAELEEYLKDSDNPHHEDAEALLKELRK